MNKDTAFRLLVLVALALLAYLCWLNTRELVNLELEVDKVRGGFGVTTDAPPVPPAEQTIGPNTKFEETLNG